MSNIEEMQGRIMAAMERASRGLEKLGAEQDASPDLTQELEAYAPRHGCVAMDLAQYAGVLTHQDVAFHLAEPQSVGSGGPTPPPGAFLAKRPQRRKRENAP